MSIAFEPLAQGLPPGLLLPLEWAMSGTVRSVLNGDLADLKRTIEQARPVH